jgi:hypothetical protein
MAEKNACGNTDCKVSTGFHEGLTFGSGKLDRNGYWEHPCRACAAKWDEGKHLVIEEMRKTLAIKYNGNTEKIDEHMKHEGWLNQPAWPFAPTTLSKALERTFG